MTGPWRVETDEHGAHWLVFKGQRVAMMAVILDDERMRGLARNMVADLNEMELKRFEARP